MIFPTPNLQIEDFPADRQHMSSGINNPLLIVIHHTGGSNSKLWLSRDSASNVSAQRLITKKGENIKLVPDENIANTQGYGVLGPYAPCDYDLYLPGEHIHVKHKININHICLSMELENLGNGIDPYPDIQLDMTARQCLEWQARYGFPAAIVSHAMIDSRKDDPLGFPWQRFSGLYWRIAKDYLSRWTP